MKFIFLSILNNIVIENACHLSKSPIKMYKNYTVCFHVHNLHPGANKFAPPRRQEQICSRVQICTRMQILKTPFTWPKIHPGCKFAPRVQICTRVQIAHMNEAIRHLTSLTLIASPTFICRILEHFQYAVDVISG